SVRIIFIQIIRFIFIKIVRIIFIQIVRIIFINRIIIDFINRIIINFINCLCSINARDNFNRIRSCNNGDHILKDFEYPWYIWEFNTKVHLTWTVLSQFCPLIAWNPNFYFRFFNVNIYLLQLQSGCDFPPI
ncbi:hypothetical protein O9G_005998, partial [Rozella allomycis CSF55]